MMAQQNKLNQITEKIPAWVWVGLMSVVLVILKWPHLNIPYYWDEAWPFSHAVFEMYQNGPRLLPDAIDTEISRGHPLLFHFLAAVWMKVFGTSFLAVKSFPMLLSVGLLFAVYEFGRKFFSQTAGVLAALFLLVQSVFFIQSSFLLLEVQLALLTVLTFYFWMLKKQLWYVVFGVMLLLTKETGLVAIGSVGLLSLFDFFDKKLIEEKGFIKMSLRVVVAGLPIAIAFIYFLIQRWMHGWFLFPVHVEFMSFTKEVITFKLNVIINYLFFDEGRYYLSLALALSMVFFYFIKRAEIGKTQQRILWLFLIFLIAFVAFSSLNFLSFRYLLSMMPPFALMTAFYIREAFAKHRLVILLFAIVPLVMMARSTYAKDGHGDVNRGFEDVVKVHQQMTAWCEANEMHDEVILSHFLMRVNLSSPYAGYLNNPSRPFTKLYPDFSPYIQYCIFSSVEYEPEFDSILADYDLEEVISFRKNDEWVTLYKVLDNSKDLETFNKRVRYYEDIILKSPDWLSIVKEKAEERGISLEEMIRIDAIYMVNEELRKKE